MFKKRNQSLTGWDREQRSEQSQARAWPRSHLSSNCPYLCPYHRDLPAPGDTLTSSPVTTMWGSHLPNSTAMSSRAKQRLHRWSTLAKQLSADLLPGHRTAWVA